MTIGATPSQTVGPYFKIGLDRLCNPELAKPHTPGERITISGRILDANGIPVPDAVLEIWQADSDGHYLSPVEQERQDCSFKGCGRIPTNDEGQYGFSTIKPGRVVDPNLGQQAPHINVTLFMRGLLRHLVTRIYFSDEPANAKDPILALVPEDRRITLMANPSSPGSSNLHWNVVLQGEGETVFFDW
jgi:protocatechuate 3,4-dioxygenase, alpha subunit